MRHILEYAGNHGLRQFANPHLYFSMEQVPKSSHELSRVTPVLDNLEGFREFYESEGEKEGFVEAVQHHSIVEVFAIGESGIGKGAVVEQLFKKLSLEKALTSSRRGVRPTFQYYSLAAQFQDAVAERGIISPWGEFSAEELAHAAIVAAEVGKEKLERAEAQANSPVVRLLDFVAISDPVDLGSGHLRRSITRAQHDPTYTYRIIAVTTKSDVQQKTLETRESFWRLSEDVPFDEVEGLLRNRGMKPDVTNVSVDEMRRSTGAPLGMHMVNQLVNQQIFLRQEEMREKVSATLPYIESPDALTQDPILREAAQNIYYQLLLFHDWGADSDKTLITQNPNLFRRRIPLYRKPLRDFRIH